MEVHVPLAPVILEVLVEEEAMEGEGQLGEMEEPQLQELLIMAYQEVLQLDWMAVLVVVLVQVWMSVVQEFLVVQQGEALLKVLEGMEEEEEIAEIPEPLEQMELQD